MKKLQMHTPNFINKNMEKLVELFPGCVTESSDAKGNLKKSIDYNLLKQELSENIIVSPHERYQINWPGKREALVSANIPTDKTLCPYYEESVDFDNTENLYIEGDNLEVLKLLQKSYLSKIKIIYIDPPYNTGKDFVYKDNFKRSKEEEFEASGQRDAEGGKLVANTESNGRFHSDWLSMMYSRLKIARNLLKDDGAIVIHIDEAEYENLHKICQEIFGEDNDLGTVIWDKGNPKGDSKAIATQHEYIIMFTKNISTFTDTTDFTRPKKNAQKMLSKANQLYKKIGKQVIPDDIKECIKNYSLAIDPKDYKLNYTLENANTEYQKWLSKQNFSNGEKAYKYIDENGKVYRGVSMAWPNKKKAPDDYFIPLKHPVTGKPCSMPDKGWRNPSTTMKKLLDAGLIIFGNDETKQPERKYLLEENMNENIPSILYFGGSDDDLFKKLNLVFDNPKPYRFVKEILSYFSNDDDIIVDFFSGSATTAHSVMQLNAEDGGNRQFIMVQFPEETEEKSEAFKEGYKTIAEIGKERIRRAGIKIKEDDVDKEGIENLDIGFRVLKIDSSNMKDVYYAPDAIDQTQLQGLVDNVKEDRTSEDLLFQVLLDWGVDLTLPIFKKTIMDKEVFFVDEDTLAACFDEGIDEAFVKELAGREIMRVVFKDSGFASDAMKNNVEQIFAQLSPDTEVRAI